MRSIILLGAAAALTGVSAWTSEYTGEIITYTTAPDGMVIPVLTTEIVTVTVTAPGCSVGECPSASYSDRRHSSPSSPTILSSTLSTSASFLSSFSPLPSPQSISTPTITSTPSTTPSIRPLATTVTKSTCTDAQCILRSVLASYSSSTSTPSSVITASTTARCTEAQCILKSYLASYTSSTSYSFAPSLFSTFGVTGPSNSPSPTATTSVETTSSPTNSPTTNSPTETTLTTTTTKATTTKTTTTTGSLSIVPVVSASSSIVVPTSLTGSSARSSYISSVKSERTAKTTITTNGTTLTKNVSTTTKTGREVSPVSTGPSAPTNAPPTNAGTHEQAAFGGMAAAVAAMLFI